MTTEVRFLRFLTWLFAAATIAVVPLTVTMCSSGCASASRNAYVSSGVTHTTARVALTGWDEYLKQQYDSVTNLSTTNPAKAEKLRAELLAKEVKVRDAYEKYQAAQLGVLTASQAFSQIPSSDPNAPRAEDQLTAAISAAGVTLAVLVDLIQQFGVKL